MGSLFVSFPRCLFAAAAEIFFCGQAPDLIKSMDCICWLHRDTSSCWESPAPVAGGSDFSSQSALLQALWGVCVCVLFRCEGLSRCTAGERLVTVRPHRNISSIDYTIHLNEMITQRAQNAYVQIVWIGPEWCSPSCCHEQHRKTNWACLLEIHPVPTCYSFECPFMVSGY